MPRYQQLVSFMADVRRANPKFERWVKSDLRPLINVLEDDQGNAVQVQAALQALSAAKVAKYRDAIWYLQATYPGLAPPVRAAHATRLGERSKRPAPDFH